MKKYNNSIGSRVFDGFNIVFMALVLILMIYPCWYVLSASLSNPKEIYMDGGFLLYPRGFNILGYREVIRNTKIWLGYANTLFYVIAGGFLSVALTSSAAFVLSRKSLPGKNTLLVLMLFTMYFSGGLIPTYIVVKELGLIDTPLAMILPNAVSTYNLIITLTYFRSLPDSIEEAARIDGASHYTIFLRIMLPLSTPILAVISLYYMVGIWNNYFTALIYLSKRNLLPLQIILREILIQNSTDSGIIAQVDDAAAYAENIKYATIVVSTIPILCVYPFLQKFFVKGIMIGAVKG